MLIIWKFSRRIYIYIKAIAKFAQILSTLSYKSQSILSLMFVSCRQETNTSQAFFLVQIDLSCQYRKSDILRDAGLREFEGYQPTSWSIQSMQSWDMMITRQIGVIDIQVVLVR